MKSRTGYVWNELYAWHNTGMGGAFLPAGGYVEPGQVHAENADTKRRIENLLEVSGLKRSLVEFRDFPSATKEDVLTFHTADYVERIIAMSAAGGGDAGELTPFGPGSYEIALKSAGGCLAAGRAIMKGEIDNAYVLNRPPGHHAEADIGRGFCIFGNGVITANVLRREFGLKRIAFFDWDVHHGNGTQKGFYGDPDTLVISAHQYQFYPQDSGFVEENGEGKGVGTNINIPLPPGSGHGAYIHAVKSVVLPALDRFKPELIIVLSGFDAGAIDPLGRNMAFSKTYREMTELLMGAAERHCNKRLLMLHEGGYSAAYTPFCGLAVLETLSGVSTGVEDPFADFLGNLGMQDLQPHQAEMIAKSAALCANVPV